MCKWYKEMNCYLIVPEQPARKFKTDKIAQRAELENSFRNYAAVFDKVKIVIHDSQAKDYFLNFPYICHSEKSDRTLNLKPLLNDAASDAIFIGHTGMGDFPISLLANLLRSYNGELFMGYKTNNQLTHQMKFGIYHKALVSKTADSSSKIRLDSLDKDSYKLFPLPETSDLLKI